MPAPLKSYIERILNVLAEIDNLGGDKKEIYKELAGDGYDRTVVSQVVGHIRKKAAKPGKFAEQSALFDLYLTEYEGVGTRVATHAAREFPEHDAETGVIIEPEAAMLPQTGGRISAPATSAEQVAVESSATHTEPEAIPPVADPATVASVTGDGERTASSPDAFPGATNVTAFRTHNPNTHFLNSTGLPRLHGCLKADACGGTHRALCHSCLRNAETASHQGGAA